MTGYGESAPADKLFPYFGFTVENVVEKALSVIYGLRCRVAATPYPAYKPPNRRPGKQRHPA
jgi:hypothetical protein